MMGVAFFAMENMHATAHPVSRVFDVRIGLPKKASSFTYNRAVYDSSYISPPSPPSVSFCSSSPCYSLSTIGLCRNSSLQVAPLQALLCQSWPWP